MRRRRFPLVPRIPFSAQEFSFLSVTIAAYRSTFGCAPHQFQILRNDDGSFHGIACTGEVDSRFAETESA
jgi:hypothetical protein